MVVALIVIFMALAIGLALFVSRLPPRRADTTPEPPPVPAMWTDAIDLGLAALHHFSSLDDGEIGDELERLGIAPWLARRLVTWIPSAFVQVVLTGTRHLDAYADGARGPTRRMSEDPIFAAAMACARELGPARALPFAERSGAMNAVRGSAPSLDVAELAELGGECAVALVEPLPAIAHGDGGVPEARAIFAALFAGHGHAPVAIGGTAARVATVEIDAFVVGHRFGPTFRAQFDFVVRDARIAGGQIVESFAGEGATYRDAVVNATGKLSSASAHVLIATLIDRKACAEHVERERWAHPSGALDACLGRQLVLWADVDIDMRPLLDALIAALVREPLTREVHGLRVFASRGPKTSAVDEVLLDGRPWPAGEALCRAHPWPEHDTTWATRLFLTLTPISEPAAS